MNTVEFKFAPGNYVYYVVNGIIKKDRISYCISGCSNPGFNMEISYILFNDSKYWKSENELFASQEEAIKDHAEKLMKVTF